MTVSEGSATPPRVFVRRIDIPPAAPWDQHRAARLEAQHGAPLPGDQVVMRLRRLDPWRPNTGGRFAAAYLRRSEIAGDVVHEAVLDDWPLRFVFSDPKASALRRSDLLLTGLIVLAAIVFLALAAQKAISARADSTQRLERLEIAAARQQTLRRREQEAAREAQLIRRAGADQAGFGHLAADLAWLAQAKAPSVTLQRVQWTPGQMQITAPGKATPVLGVERPVSLEEGSALVSTWRVGAPAAPIVRAGVTRPSVRSASVAPRPMATTQ